MASARLQPPEPYDFKRPDDWPKWRRRFEQFRSASGLFKENEPQQVNTLLYCLGEDAKVLGISCDYRGSAEGGAVPGHSGLHPEVHMACYSASRKFLSYL